MEDEWREEHNAFDLRSRPAGFGVSITFKRWQWAGQMSWFCLGMRVD
jgi:hypothetical protein